MPVITFNWTSLLVVTGIALCLTTVIFFAITASVWLALGSPFQPTSIRYQEIHGKHWLLRCDSSWFSERYTMFHIPSYIEEDVSTSSVLRHIGTSHPSAIQVRVVVVGWPLRCFYAYDIMADESHRLLPGNPSGYIYTENPHGFAYININNRRLDFPVYIVASALICNICIFTVPLVSFFFGVQVLVRYQRRRRMCCLSCGYSLRGLRVDVCPECGREGWHSGLDV